MGELDDYLKNKRLEISGSLKGRIPIYLDINYWIKIREERKNTLDSEKQPLTKLIELSASKKCFFPISEMTFWEIMKQSDTITRKQTFDIVELLSGGISIISMKERVYLETKVWLLKVLGKETHDIEELIWSKLPLELTYNYISQNPLFEVQKKLVDKLEQSSINDLVESSLQTFTYKDNVDFFNEQFKKYAHENKTEREVFLSELGGYIDANLERIKDVMSSMFYSEHKRLPTVEEMENDKLPQVIYNGFKMDKIKDELPVLHIVPSLHAWTRWKQKPFIDGNDTIDFYHASFALPFCDYFFTDRRLRSGIIESKLDKLYKCTVEYNYLKVLDILSTL
jgi:hypothetical protein